MTPARLRSDSKLRQACHGMLLATAAGYVLVLFGDLLISHRRPDPLGWLAGAVLSPLSALQGLFEPFILLLSAFWFFLPAGAISGLLISRWISSHSRSGAVLRAGALGVGFALAGIAVLFLFLLVLTHNFSLHLREAAASWRFWAAVFGLGAYCSLWLVGWALWRSPVTPRRQVTSTRPLPSGGK